MLAGQLDRRFVGPQASGITEKTRSVQLRLVIQVASSSCSGILYRLETMLWPPELAAQARRINPPIRYGQERRSAMPATHRGSEFPRLSLNPDPLALHQLKRNRV